MYMYVFLSGKNISVFICFLISSYSVYLLLKKGA